MEVVKQFNSELSSLYETKPPISKAKMISITRTAMKAIKFYKHVVQSVEKFIQKCKPEYKVPGLYVIDSIVRQSRHLFGTEKDVFAPRFARNLQQTFVHLFNCPPEDKSKVIRVLNLWQKNNVFDSEQIQPLFDLADPNHPIHKEQQALAPSNGIAPANANTTPKNVSVKESGSAGWVNQLNSDSHSTVQQKAPSKVIRVLNLWQKNNVFDSEQIQPLFDLADPNHPIHKEQQALAPSNGIAPANANTTPKNVSVKESGSAGWVNQLNSDSHSTVQQKAPSKVIRVLNLWQKNNVFDSEQIQPLFDLADPNHPIHKEQQALAPSNGIAPANANTTPKNVSVKESGSAGWVNQLNSDSHSTVQQKAPSKVIRVLNLWQKNNVFDSEQIQPLFDLADPNHPIHKEQQALAPSNGIAPANANTTPKNVSVKESGSAGWVNQLNSDSHSTVQQKAPTPGQQQLQQLQTMLLDQQADNKTKSAESDQIEGKMEDIQNNNSQLDDLKQQLTKLIKDCEELYTTYNEKRNKVLEMKGSKPKEGWGDDAWNSTPAAWNSEEETYSAQTDGETDLNKSRSSSRRSLKPSEINCTSPWLPSKSRSQRSSVGSNPFGGYTNVSVSSDDYQFSEDASQRLKRDERLFSIGSTRSINSDTRISIK
ncbi:uncharacterized protein LOC128999435 [Macrosteles quadrilineatus]|uniref:uncharacterized protein LOC128999435 n=1 Tax=Macrosteles quadrilineatus TaxID=74068 RepID=UPI0023E1A452|nr:uncharacterized protein LOC128999435 [Macrosteles quadrilineatus]